MFSNELTIYLEEFKKTYEMKQKNSFKFYLEDQACKMCHNFFFAEWSAKVKNLTRCMQKCVIK